MTEENDRIYVKNNDINMLILLCNLDYNKKLAENELFNNKIQKIALEIEKEFIGNKKKEYKFQLLKN